MSIPKYSKYSGTGDIVGVRKVIFQHGGSYDTGYWTGGFMETLEVNGYGKLELSGDEAEQLEMLLLEWLQKNKYLKGELPWE